VLKRLIWFWTCDRLGPDIPLTHALLYFKRSMRWICRKKFRHFDETAEFRPHAYAICASRISIGARVTIRPGVMLFGGETEEGTITIEDDAGLAAGVQVYVDEHYKAKPDLPTRAQGFWPARPVRLCRGSFIGANAIILAGVTVGENAVVGAGSVVTSDVEPFTVVMGNPARAFMRRGAK
jgi:acetyltransferase-like isoleucine patch superfamily enzyme